MVRQQLMYLVDVCKGFIGYTAVSRYSFGLRAGYRNMYLILSDT